MDAGKAMETPILQTRRTALRNLSGLAAAAAIPLGVGCSKSNRADSTADSPPKIITNGQAVLDESVDVAADSVDLLISGESIVEIAPGLVAKHPDAEVIDASNKIIVPGGIDPHVHLTTPWVDDFQSGSQCAIAGGITTLGNMVFPVSGESTSATLERNSRRVEKRAVADFFFHAVVQAPRLPSTNQLEKLKQAGHTSLKFFTLVSQFDDYLEQYAELLEQMARLSMTAVFHCEDFATLNSRLEELDDARQTSLEFFARSRPVEAEVIAVRRVIELCRRTGATVYVVHLSSGEALRLCQQAMNEGLPVHVETRPLYLHLTEEVYRQADAQKFTGMPPIRTLVDQQRLWEGLADGSVHTVASDHAPWTLEQKLDARLTINNSRPGVNNLQHMLPMLFSDGVSGQRISLRRFVEVCSTNAARIFGLYPRKGTIAVGSDADLVVWDPEKTRTIQKADVISNSGFSIFEGRSVTGWPVMVMRRGEVVFEDDAIAKHAGPGVVIPRS